MIIKEERIGDQRLILGDCLAVMPLLDTFDAVVTDPPYGMGDLWRGGGGLDKKSSWKFNPKEAMQWDMNAPSFVPDIVQGRKAIIWGGHFFDLPKSRAWLVWDKGLGNFTTGHSELAWTNLRQPIRNLRLCPNVMTPTGKDGPKVHPTQKPVEVILWCLGFLPDAQTILDPFMGSGTTLVACHKLGRAGTGIELDPDYFDIACKRVDEATRQADLFVEPAPKPTQEVLL